MRPTELEMKDLKKKKPKIKKASKVDQEKFVALYAARNRAIESLIAVWANNLGPEIDVACDLLSKVHRTMSDKYIEIIRRRGLL
jgi:hypothetical protein